MTIYCLEAQVVKKTIQATTYLSFFICSYSYRLPPQYFSRFPTNQTSFFPSLPYSLHYFHQSSCKLIQSFFPSFPFLSHCSNHHNSFLSSSSRNIWVFFSTHIPCNVNRTPSFSESVSNAVLSVGVCPRVFLYLSLRIRLSFVDIPHPSCSW